MISRLHWEREHPQPVHCREHNPYRWEWPHHSALSQCTATESDLNYKLWSDDYLLDHSWQKEHEKHCPLLRHYLYADLSSLIVLLTQHWPSDSEQTWPEEASPLLLDLDWLIGCGCLPELLPLPTQVPLHPSILSLSLYKNKGLELYVEAVYPEQDLRRLQTLGPHLKGR